MNPPRRPIRTEVNEALVGGIRDKGREAFGMIILAAAGLVIAVVAFFVFYAITQATGHEITPIPLGLVSGGFSGFFTWRYKS